jgi:hypothetical protein
MIIATASVIDRIHKPHLTAVIPEIIQGKDHQALQLVKRIMNNHLVAMAIPAVRL